MEERGRLWNSGVRVVHYGTCDVDTEDGGLWLPMIIHQLCKTRATHYTTTPQPSVTENPLDTT